ncbi:hypothetical protein PSQ40_13600 [Curvibacter sp. HBC61]|uniref:Uncharacterized protein n=1 Tax=Curvibacter cyanobacteriorum TaxID=3026422 RepID=A0ABT5N0G1_9BURK|nr:DUF6544 family protein [Curvibacter sp. HBC61]MDD0839615.1 hypothetical protein [Curvibacter sp. HBC61]
MKMPLRTVFVTLLACLAALALGVAYQYHLTERDIAGFEARVAAVGAQQPAPRLDARAVAGLPEPVQRYFRFVFPSGAPSYGVVRLSASGQFRRPLTQGFNPTGAQQVIAAGAPALMFSATTSIMPGVWARAYDFYAHGEMEMKAKVLSSLTVVDERQTPQLNQISLRRWLLESALYPAALLPGGPVTWEPVGPDSARAVVAWNGLRASLVAHFAADGRLTHMQAETDGDLTTPYHGSGEHVARSNYQAVGQQMIPLDFTISRQAGGQLYPFWKGRIDHITFE